MAMGEEARGEVKGWLQLQLRCCTGSLALHISFSRGLGGPPALDARCRCANLGVVGGGQCGCERHVRACTPPYQGTLPFPSPPSPTRTSLQYVSLGDRARAACPGDGADCPVDVEAEEVRAVEGGEQQARVRDGIWGCFSSGWSVGRRSWASKKTNKRTKPPKRNHSMCILQGLGAGTHRGRGRRAGRAGGAQCKRDDQRPAAPTRISRFRRGPPPAASRVARFWRE